MDLLEYTAERKKTTGNKSYVDGWQESKLKIVINILLINKLKLSISMAQKIYSLVTVDVNEEGYFTNPSQWTREIAEEIAKEESIVLTEQHFAIIEFLRNRFNSGEALSIRSINHSGVIDVKTFYQLFPGAPLKKATKIAGIPKPVSCI
jgi:TusE/DsrC/DsvC family sulfur relay protein